MVEKFFPLLLLFASYSSFAAGPSSGGGGGAWVCFKDDNKTIESVSLFDLDEAPLYEDNNLDPELARLPWKEAFVEVINRLSGIDPEFAANLRFTALRILSQVEYDSWRSFKEVFFPAPPDLGHSRMPPLDKDRGNCQARSAAIFQDAPYRIFISKPVWDHFSEIQKAALMVHETLYALYRNVSKDSAIPFETDSAATRKLVGLAFSNKFNYRSSLEASMKFFADTSGWVPPFQTNGFSPRPNELSEYIQPFLTHEVRNYDAPLYVEENCSDVVIETNASSLNIGDCQLNAIEDAYRRSDRSHRSEITELKAKRVKHNTLQFSYKAEVQSPKSLVLTCKKNIAPAMTLYCKHGTDNILAAVAYPNGNKSFAGITIYRQEDYRDLKDRFIGDVMKIR